MNVKGIVPGLLILLLFGGCEEMPTTLPATVTVPPTETQARTETPTVTATATPIVPTRTPSPSPSPTATPMNAIRSFCPSIEPASSLPEIGGQLIMNSINRDHREDLSDVEYDYLLDLRTGEKGSLATKDYNYISLPFYLNDGSALVSPDRMRFAYVEYETASNEKPHLRIINSKGQQERAPAWGLRWGKIYGWADNQTLLFSADETLGPGTVVAVDVTGGGKTKILPPLPDNQLLETLLYNWVRKPIAWYGPELNKAVYPSGELHNTPTLIQSQYVLWDQENNQAIWKKQSSNYVSPVWSPDGVQFAISSGDEDESNLFVVSEEGVEKQITELGNSYGITPISARAMDWSPDGRSLAFWVMKPDSTLAWVDIESKEIHSYCIRGLPFQRPIWSPDGKWLAVNSPIEKSFWNPTHVVLINVETYHAYELVRDDKVIGWMKGK